MVDMKILRDEWYCYFPYESFFDSWSYEEISVTEEEERWIVESFKEWREVQKFIAGKLSAPKQLELPLEDTTNG